MFLRRPACTRRPPRSRIGLIIAKAISTRRLRRHRTAGRLSVLDTPKAFAATTRAHLIHVRCQYAARFTDAFYIYFEGAAHVWAVQVARTSFPLSPNHPSRCGTATIALSSRNRPFSKTRFLIGFSVSGFPRMRADRVVVATCRRGDALYAELGKWLLYAGLSSRTSA